MWDSHPTALRAFCPLFAARKEGGSESLYHNFYPLSAVGEERVVQRSVGRVSQLRRFSLALYRGKNGGYYGYDDNDNPYQ